MGFLDVVKGVLPGAVSGLFGLGSTLLGNNSNERINQKQIDASNTINRQQLALSQEALDAQKSQQAWANEQYLESRDYDRALQQTIFNREDTAISRALQDARNAGLSPLSALGMSAGAGSVVSSSSAPGSMVSNNQANLSVPNLQSNDYSSLAQSGSQIAQLLATSFESRKAQDNQIFLTKMQMAYQANEAGLGRLHEKMMKSLEHDFLINERNVEYYRELLFKLSDQDFQIKLQDIIATDAKNLENTRHSNALELADKNITAQSDLQKSQQEWQSDENEITRSGEKNRGEYLNQLISALSDGDSKMANWLRENSDILIPLIQYLDSVLVQ